MSDLISRLGRAHAELAEMATHRQAKAIMDIGIVLTEMAKTGIATGDVQQLASLPSPCDHRPIVAIRFSPDDGEDPDIDDEPTGYTIVIHDYLAAQQHEESGEWWEEDEGGVDYDGLTFQRWLEENDYKRDPVTDAPFKSHVFGTPGPEITLVIARDCGDIGDETKLYVKPGSPMPVQLVVYNIEETCDADIEWQDELDSRVRDLLCRNQGWMCADGEIVRARWF